MTSPGAPKRSWLSSFASAMAPVAPEDDGQPITRPVTIWVATVFAVLGAVVFVLQGGAVLITLNSQLASESVLYQEQYDKAVVQCTTYVGGVGTAVPSTAVAPTSVSGPLTAESFIEQCQALPERALTPELLSSVRTQAIVINVVTMIIGLAGVVGGIFLRQGLKWARRTIMAASVVALLLALLFNVASLFLLVANLLMIIGMVLCYVGKGGLFFLRVAQRRQKH
ncbi:hypothetical protein GIS00_11140 [Nakamurella sp. YIM 132087]|uniref:Uncharacterized protein n=1 Tax=Nakamurella alba TaxID=2665158 RepID=A0A7K1FK37_9ACTN|nr:hypothetical protein [Nakamurella alba]MTD14501.1 hypothetical protein [Nakamurella alba]